MIFVGEQADDLSGWYIGFGGLSTLLLLIRVDTEDFDCNRLTVKIYKLKVISSNSKGLEIAKQASSLGFPLIASNVYRRSMEGEMVIL